MSRQIKFRVWDKAKRVFIPDDVYGITATDFGAFGVMLKDWGDYRQGEYFYENSQTLIQYTGLKDKHGKDAYHKDILKGYGKLWTIEWQVEEARFWLAPSKGNSSSWKFMDEVNSMEIIGNIHQNPELIK